MKIDREPYGIVYTEDAAFKDTYGGLQGMVFLEAQRIVPREVESDTVLMFMHPIGGGTYLPVVSELARQGNHVIYCNSRYRGIDSALLMEKVVLDLGAAIADAKKRFGYDKVVLAGWSGGGALSLFYQRQAVEPTITQTPAGDPLDLTSAGLQPAAGLLLLAAHPSRHRVLVDSIDPSIRDESNPEDRDPALDLYSGRIEPPYDPEFLAEYRAAQLARNRRISAWVRDELERLRTAGHGDEERGFVVHGTMADPRFLDATLDLTADFLIRAKRVGREVRKHVITKEKYRSRTCAPIVPNHIAQQRRHGSQLGGVAPDFVDCSAQIAQLRLVMLGP